MKKEKKASKLKPPAKSEKSTAIAEYSRDEVDLIRRTVAKGASDLELRMFLYVCKHTGLNPLLRQIYSIRRREWNPEKYNAEEKKYGDYEYKMVTQVGIDGLRLIAERTGKYLGQIGPEWCGKDGQWKDVWIPSKDETYPTAARVGVVRRGYVDPSTGKSLPIWGVARWDDYSQKKKSGDLIAMWESMGPVMIAKCAESQGLRRAFPWELAGLYTHDEMGVEDPDKIQIDPAQVARIGKKAQQVHILSKQLLNPTTGNPYTEDEIHEALRRRYNVISAKELGEDKLDEIISELRSKVDEKDKGERAIAGEVAEEGSRAKAKAK